MSRSRFAVTGLTWVAAHLVIGEMTRSRAAPSGDFGVDPVVLAPRRCAVEIDVGPKSDGIDRHAHRRFERRDARAVDQRDVFIRRRIRFAARIGKGVARRLDDAQRSIHGGPEEISEEFCDQPASPRLGHPFAQQYPAIFSNRQNAAFRVEAGLQLRELFVAHQHDEMDLRQPFRALRIEECRAERDRKASIVRQAFAGNERYAIHSFSAQALYRVAVDRGNGGGHIGSLPSRLSHGQQERVPLFWPAASREPDAGPKIAAMPCYEKLRRLWYAFFLVPSGAIGGELGGAICCYLGRRTARISGEFCCYLGVWGGQKARISAGLAGLLAVLWLH